MTALDKNARRAWRAGHVALLPVAAGARIHQHALLEYDAAGNVTPAVGGPNKIFAGVATRPADNTSGAAGAISVEVRREGLYSFATTGTAVPGKPARAVDDNTVTDAGHSVCGVIVGLDGSDRVWVDIERRA